MLRRYLAYRRGEVPRVYRLLDSAAEGCLGRGPAHLLVESAAEVGFQWEARRLGWERLGLPVLSNSAGPRSCRGFCSVPGPLQTVQRAEFWGAVLAVQAADGIHQGVDNLSLVRHVGRLLDGGFCSPPFEHVTDDDLLVLIRRMPDLRGRDTVRVSEVKFAC